MATSPVSVQILFRRWPLCRRGRRTDSCREQRLELLLYHLALSCRPVVIFLICLTLFSPLEIKGTALVFLLDFALTLKQTELSRVGAEACASTGHLPLA